MKYLAIPLRSLASKRLGSEKWRRKTSDGRMIISEAEAYAADPEAKDNLVAWAAALGGTVATLKQIQSL